MILHEEDLPEDLNYAICKIAEEEGLAWGEAVFSLLVEVVPPSIGWHELGDVIFCDKGGTTHIEGVAHYFYDGLKKPTTKSMFSMSHWTGRTGRTGKTGNVAGGQATTKRIKGAV